MDGPTVKEGRSPGTDYFDELLERIRDIRQGESVSTRRSENLYNSPSDYDKDAAETQTLFFQIASKQIALRRQAVELAA